MGHFNMAMTLNVLWNVKNVAKSLSYIVTFIMVAVDTSDQPHNNKLTAWQLKETSDYLNEFYGQKRFFFTRSYNNQ